MKFSMSMITILGLAATTMGAFAQKPESNVSPDFPFTYRSQKVNGTSIAYYEQGSGEPILFLHGIPTSGYLWRNIIPQAASRGRAIAMDLAGYGKSGLPADGDYSIASQYGYLNGFIDSLHLTGITLVVNDLGSLLGLKYAVEHPDNIKRIVLIEAVFMPAEKWYAQLQFMQKMMFALMRNPKLAEKVIVAKNKIPSMMMRMATMRKLSDTEMNQYLAPYATDIERRKVLLYGPGPATFPKHGISKQKGDFADELNGIAEGLKKMSETKPFLLIHASPGMITGPQAVEYARRNFKRLTLLDVGKGKHFLPEDHPTTIAKGLVEWLSATPP
jgi:haloalkane dehalogenase